MEEGSRESGSLLSLCAKRRTRLQAADAYIDAGVPNVVIDLTVGRFAARRAPVRTGMRIRGVSPVAVVLWSSLVAGCGAAPASGGAVADEATPSGSVAAPPTPAPSGPGTASQPRRTTSSSASASPIGDPGLTTDPVLAPAPDPAPTEDPPATDPEPPAPLGPNAGAGPKPALQCSVVKNGAGFFTRVTSKSAYVAYVPASYDGSTPMRLVVGLHGCGDSAANFAAWGINPYDTRGSQDHIGISIGGKDGKCWSSSDDDKVLAAVDDISSCFWVHQKKVVIAGYSSGGISAYRVGLQNAARFAGILIEDSGLYATGKADALLASASWKLNIAHRTHASDTEFPLAKVQADWTKINTAGFAISTSVTPGTHDGTSADWSDWLVPQSAGFVAP